MRSASPEDAARWDGFLAAQPGLTPLSRFAWGDILRDVFSTSPLRLIAETASGEIAGTLFAYAARGNDGRPRIYSLNRGLVATTPVAEAALLQAVGRLQIEHGAALAELSSARQPATAEAEGPVRHAIVKPLAATEEETWSGLRAKTRNMVRKAEKNQVSLDRDIDALDAFYDIYAERMLELNVAIYGRALFHAIFRVFPDDVELIVARQNGRTIGGLFLIMGSDTAVYPAQATLSAYMDTAATQALIWAAAQTCIARGIRRLDMGESRPDSPVYRSKVNFGGEPEPSHSLQLSHPDVASRPAALGTRVLGRICNEALRKGPSWAQRRAGLWLKRQGRLLF